MATQIVMDQTGDTRHEFDPDNAEALARAEQRFRELTGAGFTAAFRTGPGEANFAAIQAWNAAGVYQKAIALMGRQIDGGE